MESSSILDWPDAVRDWHWGAVRKGGKMTNRNVGNVGKDLDGRYTDSFYREVFLCNAKKYAGILVAVLVVVVTGRNAVFMIGESGGPSPVSVKTTGTAKFEKAGNSVRDGGVNTEKDAGVLAGTLVREGNSGVKSMVDTMTTIDFSTAGGLVDHDGDIQEHGTESLKRDTGLEEFDVYTSCIVNMRGEPMMGDNIISVEKMGRKFTVVGQNGDWYKVKWGADGYAYVNKTCVSDSAP